MQSLLMTNVDWIKNMPIILRVKTCETRETNLLEWNHMNVGNTYTVIIIITRKNPSTPPQT